MYMTRNKYIVLYKKVFDKEFEPALHEGITVLHNTHDTLTTFLMKNSALFLDILAIYEEEKLDLK